MRSADPARMSASDRLAELGELLAAGVQRIHAREGKPALPQNEPTIAREQLDVLRAAEAPCRPPAEVPA